ncbi:MAG: hypothetical protein GY914_01955, partial [Prochlorococcus sp.]|nr:hypothetical protein [Prochlorococcus sp.]
MASFLSSGTSDVLRRGAFGLALALPLLTTPVRAQTVQQDGVPSAEEVTIDDTFEVAESIPPDGVVQEVAETEEIQVRPAGERDQPLDFADQDIAEPRVLITEVIIEGIAGHPEQERVEIAAYDAMRVRPGSRVTRDELKGDLDAIYATGWFSDVRIEPTDGPLGVQLVVQVLPNPLLTKVELDPPDSVVPESVIEETFSPDYGRTLNLNELQVRMNMLKQWYSSEGYSLARISGPNRITANGVVQLKVVQ